MNIETPFLCYKVTWKGDVYIIIFCANYATYNITFINLYVVVNIAHFSYAIKEVIPNMKDEHKEEYKRLGLNIAYYRKAKGLSQIQLSDKINVSRTHMSRIENNDCAVSLDVIFSIAKALEVPVYKLFEFR